MAYFKRVETEINKYNILPTKGSNTISWKMKFVNLHN